MFRALADLAHRHPRRVLIATVLAFALGGAFGGSVADRLHPYGADDPASETVRADKRIREVTGLEPNPGLIAVVDAGRPLASREARAKVERVVTLIEREPSVGRTATYYRGGGPALRSRDGRSTYVAAVFKPGSDKSQQEVAERLADKLDQVPGVSVGGFATASAQVNETVEHDLQRAEMLAFPLLFLLALWFFRSVVAALLPLLVGALSIVGTFVGLRLASEATAVSIFALNLATGLGLGLAIDYSLFVISRYREEIAAVGPGREALRRTMATAGRTVLFSSLTVAGALASLLTFPQRFLYSMGIGGVLVALLAAAVALLVLPAVLSLLGERVNALSPRFLKRAAERDALATSRGFWYRLSRFVMRRPGRIALASAAVMIALGLPFLGVKFTSVDASVLPERASARQVDDVLQRDFPPNRTSPAGVLIEGASPAQARRFAARLGELPGAASVSPPRRAREGAQIVDVVPARRALTEETQDLVREIRALPAPFEVSVTGETADFVDQKTSLAAHLPVAIAIVFAASFVVLFLMTGSVVLPIKATLMNVLTVTAAFGVLVLIFQDGRLEGVLDYVSQGALERTMPILLFAVVFGLSTDYGVFLLSRIKEARDAGASDSESVAIGLERTGRIVTAAALLFCVAIGAFATSEIIFIKENGVGTAVAVLLDASIVRALLVPSLMEMLGRWNWWAPGPLRRLHQRIGLSEAAA